VRGFWICLGAIRLWHDCGLELGLNAARHVNIEAVSGVKELDYLLVCFYTITGLAPQTSRSEMGECLELLKFLSSAVLRCKLSRPSAAGINNGIVVRVQV
jgi:hypothetical protein